MLNTDIMRFFAIMALCLMAIFALVQSTAKSQPEDSAPRLIDEVNLKNQIETLEHKKVELQKELKQLESRLTADKIVESQKARKKFAKQEINYAGKSLTAAKLAVKQKKLQQARKKSAVAKMSLNAVEKVIDQLKSPAEKIKKTKNKSQEKGFVLRFSDNRALYTLVKGNTVQLYLIADSLSWAYSIDGSRGQFIKKKPGNQFYQMTSESVPRTIVEAGHQVVSHHGKEGLLYGVVLPAALRQQINSCMQSSTGGTLTIQGDGHLQCSGG